MRRYTFIFAALLISALFLLAQSLTLQAAFPSALTPTVEPPTPTPTPIPPTATPIPPTPTPVPPTNTPGPGATNTPVAPTAVAPDAATATPVIPPPDTLPETGAEGAATPANQPIWLIALVLFATAIAVVLRRAPRG